MSSVVKKIFEYAREGRGLVRQVVKCKETEEFEKMLNLANREAAG